ncbi:MAG: trigger factor, partial [Planctomycetota bacterium]
MESAAIQFTVEPAGPCRKRVKVTIPHGRVAEEFDKSYKQWIKSVPIPGFRPGKAPRKLVEKRYGEQVTEEVKRALLDAAYEEALVKNNLSPISEPEVDAEKIDLSPEKELGFDFTVTVKPEFELPDLKGIGVDAPSAEPTEAEIDASILALRKRKATLRPVEGEAVEEGDVVTLHFHAKAGGEEVLHHDNLLYEVGSRFLGGLVAEGLDEALAGKKAGATVEAKAFVPAHEEGHPLAGMDLSVTAEVMDHKRPQVPALDANLAAAYDFESLDALLDAVRSDVRTRKERDRERAIEDAALAQLVGKLDFELPQDLIAREAEDLARRAAYEMQMRGEPEEEVAKKAAELRARRGDETARELKAFFVLDRIAEKERILVTETEVREAIAILAAYNEKSPEQLTALLRESGRLGQLRNQLK